MPDVKEYQALKAKADRLRAEADRAAGARDAALATLQTDFGVDTIEAAEALLADMQAEAEAARLKYENLYEAFEAEWGDKLK